MSSSNPQLPTDSRIPQILAGSIIPAFLSSIFVLGRLYTKAVLVRNWGWDDTLITISWLSNIVLTVLNCCFPLFGFGHHMIFMNPSNLVPTLLLTFISRLVYQFVLFVIKLGMCIFYLRVFQDRTSRLLVYSIIGFLVGAFIPVQILTIFMCTPVSGAWSVYPAECMPRNPTIYFAAGSNIITDVCLLAFVIPRILSLSLGRRQKLSLLAVFSLGVLVVIAAIVRLIRYIQDYQSEDFAWVGYDIPIWSAIEVGASLFCASAPCLRPLIRKIAPCVVQPALAPASSLNFEISVTPNAVETQNCLSAGITTNAEAIFDLERQKQKNVLKLEGTTTNVVWAESPRFEIGPEDDECGSQSGIMNSSGRVGDIMKTVEITVTDGLSPGDEQNVSRENSTMRFEHV